MKVQKRIKYDQEKIKMLVHDIEKLGQEQADLRAPLFNKLKKEIEILHNAEKDVLYDAVNKDKEIVEDMVDEKETIHGLLQNLSDLPESDQKWHDKFSKLKSMLFDHIEREQGELMPAVEGDLDTGESKELSEDLSEHKDEQWDVNVMELPNDGGPTKKRDVC